MILRLSPYPAYKDSGVEWLGQIPAHWQVRRLKHLLHEVNSRSEDGSEQLLSVSQYTGVTPRKINGEFDSRASSLVGYKVVDVNDLVVNIMLAWNGSMGVSRHNGVVSPAYCVYRFRQSANPWYYHDLLRQPIYKGRIKTASTGVVESRLRLYSDDLFRIEALLPPGDEQDAIVRFVEHTDRRVNRLIKAKRRLIELLHEQKQAVIHRAVTVGLDGDAPRKLSGVDWLGDIPAHWKLRRLKFLTCISSGQVDPRQEQYKDYILIAPNHIESGTGRILAEVTAATQGADSGKYIAQAGQVIYSKIRPNLRKAAIAKTICLCSADMYPISPSASELRSEYFLLLLLSKPVTRYVVDCSMRVAMPKVNREALGDCWLWYPNLKEQDRILAFLPQELAPLNVAIDQARREIELIREYRTRLIADVVTGKVDVRGVAFPVSEAGAEWENIGNNTVGVGPRAYPEIHPEIYPKTEPDDEEDADALDEESETNPHDDTDA